MREKSFSLISPKIPWWRNATIGIGLLICSGMLYLLMLNSHGIPLFLRILIFLPGTMVLVLALSYAMLGVRRKS